METISREIISAMLDLRIAKCSVSKTFNSLAIGSDLVPFATVNSNFLLLLNIFIYF
jgi:hypothetical protein